MSSLSLSSKTTNALRVAPMALALVALGISGCAVPGEQTPSASAASVAAPRALSPQIERLASFEVGQDRAPIAELDAFISKASPAAKASIELDLLALLERPSITDGARETVLRLLCRVGTGASVPSLARLLNDGHWSPYALTALQQISDPEADVALFRALSQTQGEPRLALINAVGRRQIQPAVPSLALLLKSEDPEVVKAALNALGFMDTPAAYSALREQRLPALFYEDRASAMMSVISRIADLQAMPVDLKPGAAANCRAVIKSDLSPVTLRSSAIVALLKLEGDAALPDLVAALKDKSRPFALSAARALAIVRPQETARVLGESWSSLPTDAQSAVIGLLSEVRDPSARSFALLGLDSKDDALRLVSVQALGLVGRSDDFERLLALASGKDEVGAGAIASLSRIPDPAINGLLRAKYDPAQPEAAAMLLGISAARSDREVFPQACAILENPARKDPVLRAGAVAAAGNLALPNDLARLVGILLTMDDASEIRVLEKAFGELATVHDAPTEAAYLLLGAIPGATPAQKRPLRRALAVLDAPEAKQYFAKILADGPGEEWRDAIRAMGNSKFFAHVMPIIEAGKKATAPADRRLAVRSAIILIQASGAVDPRQRGEAYLAAWELTDRDEERLEILKELDWMRPLQARKFRDEMKR